MRSGFYPGSFDPLTNGHIDVLRNAFALVDRVVVAIGIHPGKTPMFTPAERMQLVHDCCGPLARKAGVTLEATTFDGLTVDAAGAADCTVLIRGLRDGTDLDYEMQLAGMNRTMAPAIHTVFVPASPLARPITATLVRQINQMGGDVSGFVPPEVLAALKQKSLKR